MGTTTKLSETNQAPTVGVEEYAAPAIVCEQALVKDWRAERARFDADPDKFWEEIARQFEWSKPWTKVSAWDGLHHQWFLGASCNITVNALDRHARSEEHTSELQSLRHL